MNQKKRGEFCKKHDCKECFTKPLQNEGQGPLNLLPKQSIFLIDLANG